MGTNFSRVYAAALEGVEARLVEVETDLHVGLHAFNIVGLADKALSEAKERVSSALKNSGVRPPTKENRKIVVNLAPADIKKTGSHYDLAIAVGYLLASQQVKPFQTKDKMFVGELALDGSLRPVNGSLSITRLAAKKKFKFLFVPKVNAAEAAIISGIKIIPLENFTDIIDYLEGNLKIRPQPPTMLDVRGPAPHTDLSEIKGQGNAKRALLIAAAGGHNLLMIGAPGGGKTMLAQALAGILPPLALEELIEATQIYSAAGLLGEEPYIAHRPFRAPHHTASEPAVIGGGSYPRPGEISLAHRGVLFLDELPEFHRDVLESLRQPLESGRVVVARSRSHLNLPARFVLVAAMNPCPCGYQSDDQRRCTCMQFEIHRYQRKVSGPLLDRIDLQIYVPRVELRELRIKNKELSSESEEYRGRVIKARQLQSERFSQLSRRLHTNSELSSKLSDKLIKLTPEAERFIDQVWDRYQLTARGYYRILKVAQTIADLEESPVVKYAHISEAFSYRLRQGLEFQELKGA
mgnify:CR=1 FL=1